MGSLVEVARRAGVAPSTASRALNHPELLSREVVARVRAVAEELGYAPNPFARSLRVRESRTLGLIVPDNTNPFFAEVARGIEAACFRAGYSLILANSGQSLEREAAQARVLYEKRVDGVLLFNVADGSAPTMTWLLERKVPIVLLERRSPGPPVDCVVSDNHGGVTAAVDHLVRHGHRRIAALVGRLDAPHYRERLGAFRDALMAHDLAAPPSHVHAELANFGDGELAAATLLALSTPPTALFCANDTLAIGALRVAAQVRAGGGEATAVVGYGDNAIASYLSPALTSVVQDKDAVGAGAVRVLLRRIAREGAGGTPRPRVQVVPTRLVVRESTQPGWVAPPGYSTTSIVGTMRS